MKKLYYTSYDGGDGSRSVEFFDSAEAIEFLIEKDPESYSDGDGGEIGQLNLPDDTDFSTLGVTVTTLAEVQADWVDED